MTNIEIACLVAYEVVNNNIPKKSRLKLEAPEVDMEDYTEDYGYVHERYDDALMDWLEKTGESLDNDAFQNYITGVYDPISRELSKLTCRRARRVCERILKAHNIVYNCYE